MPPVAKHIEVSTTQGLYRLYAALSAESSRAALASKGARLMAGHALAGFGGRASGSRRIASKFRELNSFVNPSALSSVVGHMFVVMLRCLNASEIAAKLTL